MCCTFCHYKNLHTWPQIYRTIWYWIFTKRKYYNKISKKWIIFLNDLKNKIENEINNQLYEKTIKDVTNSYFIQQEKLIKEGNDLKKKLQNEVTGVGGN